MVGARTGSYWVIGEKRMAGAVTNRRSHRHNEGTNAAFEVSGGRCIIRFPGMPKAFRPPFADEAEPT
jgi:hypothetical protein